MTAEADRLLPGRTARVNLATDLVIVWTGVFLVADRGGAGFDLTSRALILVLVTSLWGLLGLVLRHYDPGRLRARAEDLGITSLLAGAILVTVAFGVILLPHGAALPAVERLVPAVWLPIVAARFLVFRPRYRREVPTPDAIVVGTGALARATEASLGDRIRIKGFVRVPGDEGGIDGGLVLGELPELYRVLVANPVDEVYVAEEPGAHQEILSRVAGICEAMGLAFAVPLPTFRLGRARAGGNDDGYVHYEPEEDKPYQRAAKRLLDVALSAAALVVLSPFLFAVAVAIKLESRGPIFYRQRRVGLHGRPFDMLKFRSMAADADRRRAELEALNEQEGPVFKIRDDPRVTRVGRFIRRFSIDELPQLINVLRGEMSLVGPRPPIPTEVDLYEQWQRRRLSVRPGITCIWQVSGRNDISFDRWMLLDMQYIDHWSLRLDLALLVKTIPAVFSARGAS